MANCGAGLVKIILFVFNFVFFALGLAFIIGGSIALVNYDDYEMYTGNTGFAVLVTFISVGSFIFVTGFFGCCGALKQHPCMLYTYSAIILLLLVTELGTGIAGYVMREDVSNQIDTNMANVMMKYHEDDIFKQSFDDMQQGLECCGTLNYTDWFGLFDNSTYDAVPVSCCRDEGDCDNTHVSPQEKIANQDIYTTACAESLKATLQENMTTIILVCVSVAVVECVIIFLACCLARSGKDDTYETV